MLVIFFQMPRRTMPYVESPMVAVVSMMPGLSAEEMEPYFSKPIEEWIVSIEFWYGTDMKKAPFDVQRLVTVYLKPGAKIVRFTRAPEPGKTGFVEQALALTDLKPGWIVSVETKHEGDKEVADVVKVVLER